ncbi:MAG: histidine phosphatase family protein [Desulfobulbaceae bacterium]|nr:histidine phosphatase family protein [Desulfobulbaceae bacterium]
MKNTTNDITSVTTFGLLRHGQTEWNTLKRIQGSADSPLTTQGKEDTAEWSDTLKKYHWDRIIASDLGRVRATVEIINQKLNLPVTFDTSLREQHWGSWEGLTLPSIQKNFKEELARRVAMGWQFSAPGGESRLAVRDRVLATLLKSGKKWPGQKILVVCHQGVVKSVLYSITKRKFMPGEDPLLQHNRLHIISCTHQHFSAVQLNIPQRSEP